MALTISLIKNVLIHLIDLSGCSDSTSLHKKTPERCSSQDCNNSGHLSTSELIGSMNISHVLCQSKMLWLSKLKEVTKYMLIKAKIVETGKTFISSLRTDSIHSLRWIYTCPYRRTVDMHGEESYFEACIWFFVVKQIMNRLPKLKHV